MQTAFLRDSAPIIRNLYAPSAELKTATLLDFGLTASVIDASRYILFL